MDCFDFSFLSSIYNKKVDVNALMLSQQEQEAGNQHVSSESLVMTFTSCADIRSAVTEVDPEPAVSVWRITTSEAH